LSFNLNKRTVPGFVKISGMKMFVTQNLSIKTKSKNFVSNDESIQLKSNGILNQNIKVYPNPIIDDLTVETGSDLTIKSIRIYDMNARIQYNKNDIYNSSMKIDTSKFPLGIYILEGLFVDGSVSRKILVKSN
jgi:hypothetical protein